MNVVFVHGILDNGSIFNKMIAYFEQQGVRCYAPSLTPSDGRTGLDELAIQLQALYPLSDSAWAPSLHVIIFRNWVVLEQHGNSFPSPLPIRVASGHIATPARVQNNCDPAVHFCRNWRNRKIVYRKWKFIPIGRLLI
jgi:hypothetical protein